MKTTEAKNSTSSSNSSKPFFNKGGEGTFFAQKQEANAPFFQAKLIQKTLAVGAPNDPFEQEADKVGRQVMDNFGQASSIQTKLSNLGVQKSLIQPMPIGTRISRMVQYRQNMAQAKCENCEEEMMAQPKSMGIQLAGEGGMVSSNIEQRINSQRGSGSPMDAQTKGAMESSFGADFNSVKIHTGTPAVQMSQKLNAHAFTVGSDIFFNKGRYQPQTKEGAGLLAHELTHTVQQGAAVQNKRINRRPLSKMLSKHEMAHLSTMNTDTLSRKEMAQLERMPEEEMMQQKEVFESKEVDKVQKKDGGLSLRRCGGRNTAPSNTTPTLTKSTVSGPTGSNCGGFNWEIQWGLNNSSASTNGWIVQKVEVDHNVKDCAGGDFNLETGGGIKPSWYPIWEAWEVKNGVIHGGPATNPPVSVFGKSDIYGQGSLANNSKGSFTVNGNAEYYDGLTLPASFKVTNKAPAHILPVTTTQPTLTGGTGSISHNLTATWDCCTADKSTKITTV